MGTQPSVVAESAMPTLRSAVKPEGPSGVGHVGGAWWPRMRDLSAELPALLSALAVRLGRCERVTYNLTDWGPVPRCLVVDGRTVRLEGFRSQHPDTVTVIGTGGQRRLTLLVVPPGTDPGTARRVLATAAEPANVDSVEELLGPGAVRPNGTATATQGWETEGGSLRSPEPQITNSSQAEPRSAQIGGRPC
jgi:hypothetical protein